MVLRRVLVLSAVGAVVGALVVGVLVAVGPAAVSVLAIGAAVLFATPDPAFPAFPAVAGPALLAALTEITSRS